MPSASSPASKPLPSPLFVTCARGLEPLLVDELRRYGLSEVAERGGGVTASGTWEQAYRACLWSRLASRVLLPLAHVDIPDADALYAAAKAIDWPGWFDVSRTFAIDVAGRSNTVTHTNFAALRVKDALADRFREVHGRRPDVDTSDPDISIHVHLHAAQATISLDLSGESLHRRGYRLDSGGAPLKENLAAAILIRAHWPEIAAAGGALLDPMCGSGTLLLEAALMAGDVAPGLGRTRHGFLALTGADAAAWQALIAEAEQRKLDGAEKIPPLFGRDIDPAALKAARSNTDRAGLRDKIQFELADVSLMRPPTATPGLVVSNPPYGERMGSEAEMVKLYSLVGAKLKESFGGWRAAIFTGRPDLGPRMGLRAEKLYAFYNGDLPCKLLLFEIPVPAEGATTILDGDFANRLRKNLKHLGKWAKRTGVTNYRLYDADLPDYAVAVDLYQSASLQVHVQEYAPPKTVDPVAAERRLREGLNVIQQVLDVPISDIHLKVRKQQKGDAQYTRQGESGAMHIIDEHGCRLQVNFTDYLDTGVFLDHRPLRLRIRAEAEGARFLNLFCYTGSATAQAAVGGAIESVSVDLSNTYLDWARENLRLNGVRMVDSERRSAKENPHRLYRADCLAWLREQADKSKPPQFDLILCDPPTFSNSKKMDGTLDIQRDHVELITLSSRLLAPNGTLYFSTNRKRFKLDDLKPLGLDVEDITPKTLDEDFKRPPPAHRAWAIRRVGNAWLAAGKK
ncbi:MAG: bifunctional 23S rRNA (guanine(2069)-N(7))-methyltransferase RlmK/23S rRNA (guanine(2445)-N(2))-methyltransferase RlmL [Nevskia sp.]